MLQDLSDHSPARNSVASEHEISGIKMTQNLAPATARRSTGSDRPGEAIKTRQERERERERQREKERRKSGDKERRHFTFFIISPRRVDRRGKRALDSGIRRRVVVTRRFLSHESFSIKSQNNK